MSAEILAISQGLAANYLSSKPTRSLEYFDSLESPRKLEILLALKLEDAQKVLSRLTSDSACRIIESNYESLSPILVGLDPGRLARITHRLPEEKRDKVLNGLPQGLQSEIQTLVRYPENCAGSLMDTSVLSFHKHDLVKDAILKIREIRTKKVANIFLVDLDGKLTASIPIQEIIGSDDHSPLHTLTAKLPVAVTEMAHKDEVIEVAEKNQLASIPVIDQEQHLLGVIRYADLVSIIQQEALVDIQQMVGVSKDEKALSAPFFSMRKRLPWLTINLITTFVAAFVVGMFEATIAKITALAVLLPVVAGQSGNTGAQAQAVTMRGLALREIRLRHKWRVLAKEAYVGLINGVAIGVMCGLSVVFWSHSVPLGLVIGVSMVLAMVAASLSGAGIPMILTALGQDPAQSSSIILTTITDIVGFLSFLGLATIFASYLIPS